ncbi:MAG: hypothetical protein JST00_36755 [Deltaproteobacteria bacterium]|nr:hypothetical protein [Deltaproteobacteria bacterium]
MATHLPEDEDDDDDARDPIHDTVALRGDELDELLAASSDEGDGEEDDEEDVEEVDGDDIVTRDDVVPYRAEPDDDRHAVPVVESTVVLPSSAHLARALRSTPDPSARHSAPPLAHSVSVAPVAFTPPEGIASLARPSAPSASALVVLGLIAAIAIAAGIVVGGSLRSIDDALSSPSAAAVSPPPAQPHTLADERTPLVSIALREKAKPSRTTFSTSAATPRSRPALTGGPTQTAYDAELRAKVDQAEALGEAQLNRPF